MWIPAPHWTSMLLFLMYWQAPAKAPVLHTTSWAGRAAVTSHLEQHEGEEGQEGSCVLAQAGAEVDDDAVHEHKG